MDKHPGSVSSANRSAWFRMEVFKRYEGGSYWQFNTFRGRWEPIDTSADNYANKALRYETTPPPDYEGTEP